MPCIVVGEDELHKVVGEVAVVETRVGGKPGMAGLGIDVGVRVEGPSVGGKTEPSVAHLGVVEPALLFSYFVLLSPS